MPRIGRVLVDVNTKASRIGHICRATNFKRDIVDRCFEVSKAALKIADAVVLGLNMYGIEGNVRSLGGKGVLNEINIRSIACNICDVGVNIARVCSNICGIGRYICCVTCNVGGVTCNIGDVSIDKSFEGRDIRADSRAGGEDVVDGGRIGRDVVGVVGNVCTACCDAVCVCCDIGCIARDIDCVGRDITTLEMRLVLECCNRSGVILGFGLQER